MLNMPKKRNIHIKVIVFIGVLILLIVALINPTPDIVAVEQVYIPNLR